MHANNRCSIHNDILDPLGPDGLVELLINADIVGSHHLHHCYTSACKCLQHAYLLGVAGDLLDGTGGALLVAAAKSDG